MKDDVLARRMFYGGCAFLPWLWFVNVLYFRKQVYGPIPFIDSTDDESASSSPGSNSIAGGVPDITRMGDDDDESDDDASDRDSVPDEQMKAEIRKWVGRSATGSLIGFAILVAWNISFQVSRNSFGPEWFIMSQEEDERTGW